MSKHTPGPWTHTVNYGDWFVSSGIYTVALTYEFPDGESEVAEANARLIAAAPDLLEAAQAIADSVLSTGQIKRLPDSDGYYSEPIHQDEMAKLLAAIAKATGND